MSVIYANDRDREVAYQMRQLSEQMQAERLADYRMEIMAEYDSGSQRDAEHYKARAAEAENQLCYFIREIMQIEAARPRAYELLAEIRAGKFVAPVSGAAILSEGKRDA